MIEGTLIFRSYRDQTCYKHSNISLIGFYHHETQVIKILIRMLYMLFQIDGMHRFSTDLKAVVSWGGES